jgi:hypothetical protein
MQSVKVRGPNGVVFVRDSRGGVAPEPVRGAQVLSTPSCIALACMIDGEGETSILIGNGLALDPGGRPLFDGMIETPSCTVAISTVERSSVAEAKVTGIHTRIRVWTNRAFLPDRLMWGWDSGMSADLRQGMIASMQLFPGRMDKRQ